MMGSCLFGTAIKNNRETLLLLWQILHSINEKSKMLAITSSIRRFLCLAMIMEILFCGIPEIAKGLLFTITEPTKALSMAASFLQHPSITILHAEVIPC